MKTRIATSIRIFSMLTILCAAAYAQPAGGGRLAGVWEAQVTIFNCETGFVFNSFKSIANFAHDGTSIGSTSGIPQSLRTPEHGVWQHVRGNLYRFKFKSYRFLSTGAPDGWSIVEHDLELDSDNDSYFSSGTGKFYAPNGAQVGGACSSAVGTRFTL